MVDPAPLSGHFGDVITNLSVITIINVITDVITNLSVIQNSSRVLLMTTCRCKKCKILSPLVILITIFFTLVDFLYWLHQRLLPTMPPCFRYRSKYQRTLILNGLPIIEAWIRSNDMPCKVWDANTVPVPNFNGAAVEVWEWIGIFILHFTKHYWDYFSFWN